MKKPFHQKLTVLLDQGGYSSLRAFYTQNKFTFTYEFLRQIYVGEKVPSPRVVDEIAVALGINKGDFQKLASEARLAQKIRQHYQLPAATRPSLLAEKVQRYQKEGETEAKIFRLVRKLGDREKEQLLDYLKFLKQQCRKKGKPKK